MGLYIPKMKMPKNCYDCQIENDVPNCPVYMYYSATEYMEERHPDCPLVEVREPHGRLADIEDVKKAIFDYHGEDEQKVRTMINAILSSVPTVIEAEGDDYGYGRASDMRDYCEMYEPTYNQEDGSM